MHQGIILSITGLLAVAVFSAIAASTDSSKTASSARDSITVGQPAPDFKLRNQGGGETGLKEFRGQWVVLYFYPKDFTGGCTIEAHNFQRDSAAYAKAGAVILGVSVDNAASHKDFCAKEKLDFKLLADTSAVVSALYHSLKNWVGVKLSVRNTFIIDPKGNVARIFMGVKPPGHSEEVLAALVELQKKKD